MNSNEEELIRLRMRVTELEKINKKSEATIHDLTEEKDILKEDVEILTRVVRSGKEKLRLELFLKFGCSSEKYRKIFNIPVELLGIPEENLTPEEKQTIEEAKKLVEQQSDTTDADSSKKERRNRNPEHRIRGNGCGRQVFDPSYPREEVDFYLDEACPHCGTHLVEIDSVDVHEHVSIIDRSLKIIQQRKHKGYCPGCGETHHEDGTKKRKILTATATERFIPGGLASNNIIAASLVDKFFFGMSVTRISKRFRTIGVDLSEQNFSNWHLRAGAELEPIALAIKQFILNQVASNADETRLQVLDEKERADELKSWLWVLCSATPDLPAAYFHYNVSRGSDVFKEMVGDYSGFLQADGYVGYQTEKQTYNFTLSLCNAHMRRKFIDAQKASSYQEGSIGYITLDKILRLIGNIYNIDNTYRKQWLGDKIITENKFLTIRKELTLPLYKKLSAWIEGRKHFHQDDDYIIEGINYYQNHEKLLQGYLDCAYLNPDNSRVERIIKGVSIIRKNVLFAGCPDGAHAFATLESIIQTANLNDLDMYDYVTYLLNEMTKIRNLNAKDVDYSQFLPWNLTPELRKEMSIQTMSIKKKPF
jgi:transposase